ncbi:MAG: YihY/virulence factor BrkB family protein [Clostridium sp.]|nr:YihY/virulence factor BrkB family protein [Clostridium sp.]
MKEKTSCLFIIQQIRNIQKHFVTDEVSVYAAQATFFLVLSVVPFLMVLLTAIRLIPAINQNDLLRVLSRLTPSGSYALIENMIHEIYQTASAAILSVTTVAALWSAARGMQGISRGLNRINGCTRKRGYVISRLVNACYTLVFLVVCILSLLLMVFGSLLQKGLLILLPVLERFSALIFLLRAGTVLFTLIFFFMMLYTWLPEEHQKIKRQFPGALLSTAGWFACSLGFSIYFSHFKRFSYMYGSLAAVVILMLWLYFCICILFVGAEVNRHWGN